MTQQSYTTKEIADVVGVHVNTVRFYEDIGFLTKPARRSNGYRIYTDLQLEQCRLIRCVMRTEVLQNGLRKKAARVVCLCAAQDYDASISAAAEYRTMIQNEIRCAKAAIDSVENILHRSEGSEAPAMNRQDAAKVLCVTSETLRTWERSGLIKVKRRENGYRVYSAADIERLNIIRTLRSANYSLTAILRLLDGLDRHTAQSIEKVLNTPGTNEDIVSVCDSLILSLQNAATDADTFILMLVKIKEKFSTLQ